MPSTYQTSNILRKWRSSANRFSLFDVEVRYDDHDDTAPDTKVGEDAAKSPLLVLPLEVRERIYEYCLQKHPIENGDRYGSDDSIYWYEHDGFDFPTLLLTCNQIHDEFAPLVYNTVRFRYGLGDQLPNDWLRAIGSNIKHIRNCQIDYQTDGYYPTSVKDLQWHHHHYETGLHFRDVIQQLSRGAARLRNVDVSVERPPQEIPRWLSGRTEPGPEWIYMYTDADCVKVRREFFPEIAFTLRHLKELRMVEKIHVFGYKMLFDPLLLYYLRGEMGFGLRKTSGRSADGGGDCEKWELVNPHWKA